MNGALLVLKKEFLELGKDRRTLFFTFIMPLILYPVMFAMLGGLAGHDAAARAGRPSRVALADPGEALAPVLDADPARFLRVPPPAGDPAQAIREDRIDLYLEAPPDAADRLAGSRSVPLKAWYDHGNEASRLALERFRAALKVQEGTWVRARLAALGAPPELAEPVRLETVDAGDLGRYLGKLAGSLLPYLLMVMMYAGAMQHGIYVTAGEKERGTLQSLLATRLPRSRIILGKLLYIFAIGILSAVVNLASLGISVGRLMAAGGSGAQAGMAPLATPATLALTLLLMVPLGLLFANVILLGGIRARNTLEASTALTPGIFVVVLLGAFSMAPGIETMRALPYVPVLNVSLAIRKLFSRQADSWEYLVALGMTAALAILLTRLSTRMLNRESTLFRL